MRGGDDMTEILCSADYDGAVNVTIRGNGMQPDLDFTLDRDDAVRLRDLITREVVVWEEGLWR